MGTDYPEIRLAIHRGSAKSSTPPKLGSASKFTLFGPLIKSPAQELPQDTQQEESTEKGEDS
jgi:hypothetical protein